MKKETILVTDIPARISHDLQSSCGHRIQWVAADAAVRIPKETVKSFLHPGFFSAAGKIYPSLKALCAKALDKGGHLYMDIYGREVFCVAELFPCFDSYDYANETRHYRWFFIKEDGRLTRVYHTDGRNTLTVTEDVRDLEDKCREQMQKQGWLEICEQ